MPATRGSTAKRKKAEAEEQAEAVEGAPPTPKKKRMSKKEKKEASARAAEAMSHKSPASPNSYVKKQEAQASTTTKTKASRATTKKKAPPVSKKTGASSTKPPRPVDDPMGMKIRASRAPSLAVKVKQPTSALKKPRDQDDVSIRHLKQTRVTWSDHDDSSVASMNYEDSKMPGFEESAFNNKDDSSVTSTKSSGGRGGSRGPSKKKGKKQDWDSEKRSLLGKLIRAGKLKKMDYKNHDKMRKLQLAYPNVWGTKYGDEDNFYDFLARVKYFLVTHEDGKAAFADFEAYASAEPTKTATTNGDDVASVEDSKPKAVDDFDTSIANDMDDGAKFDDLDDFKDTYEFVDPSELLQPVLPPAPATPPRKGTITVSEQRLSTAQKKRKMEYDQSVFEFAQAKAAMAQKNMDEVKEKQAQIVDEVGANCKGLRDGNRILGEQSQVSGKYFESSSANAAMEVSAFAELQKSKCDYENAAEELALMEGKNKENKEQSSNGNSGGGIMAKLGFGYK